MEIESIKLKQFVPNAEVEFEVSMQPGDNFRALASTSSAAAFNGFSAKQNDKDRARIKDANNKIVQISNSLAISELLTVWRKLHIEVDSMGAVSGNSITGTITKVNNPILSPWREVETGLAYSDSPNRFENGTIVIGGISYPISSNSGTTNLKFGIGKDDASNPTVPSIGATFVAYDDDWPIGYVLPRPDTSHLATAFAPAYVLPVYTLVNDNSNVSFVANVEQNSAAMVAAITSGRQSLVGTQDHWVCYLLGAFQGPVDKDNDPGLENPMLGLARFSRQNITEFGTGALVFLESNRDLNAPSSSSAVLQSWIVAHEIGHMFEEDLIGDESLMGINKISDPKFRKSTLDKIRNTLVP